MLNKIEDAIEDIKNGKMLIVVEYVWMEPV